MLQVRSSNFFEQHSQDEGMHPARPGRPVDAVARCTMPASTLARRRHGMGWHAEEDVQLSKMHSLVSVAARSCSAAPVRSDLRLLGFFSFFKKGGLEATNGSNLMNQAPVGSLQAHLAGRAGSFWAPSRRKKGRMREPTCTYNPRLYTTDPSFFFNGGMIRV